MHHNERQTQAFEPLAKTRMSAYGIVGFGGFIDRGQVTFHPYIGGQIDFSKDSLRGNVTVFHTTKIDDTNMKFGAWTKTFTQNREDMRKAFEDIISQRNTSRVTQVVEIESQNELNDILQTKIWTKTIDNIYLGFPKEVALTAEEFYVAGFGKGSIGNSGQLAESGDDNKIHYLINRPIRPQSQITRIRINQAIWLATCRMFGINAKGAILLWLSFHSMYQHQTGNQLTQERVFMALDHVSNSLILEDVPDMAHYLTDIMIILGLFNITSTQLRPEDWQDEMEYTIYKKLVSDKALMNIFEISVDSWTESQLIVPPADLPPRIPMKILPFKSDQKYSALIKTKVKDKITEEVVDFQDPPVQLKALIYDEDGVSHELVHIRVVNAMPDGQARSTSIIYNRLIGMLGSQQEEVGQLSLDGVYPWILGTKWPETSMMLLERRHWPVIYLYNKYDKPPLSGDQTEAFMCGLRSIFGTNAYLFDISGLITQRTLTYLTGKDDKQDKTITLVARLFEIAALEKRNGEEIYKIGELAPKEEEK